MRSGPGTGEVDPPATAPANRCPLCGHRFGEGLQICGACPLHRGCGTLCCPRCGYSYAERSAALGAIGRLGRALRRLLPGPRDGSKEAA